MARNWHYLRRSKSVGWPVSQCVLALSLRRESPGISSAARLGVALESWSAIAWRDKGAGPYMEIATSGKTPADLWRFLAVVMRRGERLWLWCRGMAHALSVIGGWQVISGRAPTMCVVSDPPTIIDAVLPGIAGSVRFLDTRNVGIDATGEQLEPASCAADLRIRLCQYQQLIRELDLGGLRCTIAAQAWHGWRFRFLQCPVEVHDDTRRLNVEKDSCFGGRNEVYRAGLVNGPVYEIDASAHYPACATDNPLPARTCRPADLVGLSPEDATRRGILVIAKGRVYTEKPLVPCEDGGRTIYPVGSWPATYCWPEVELIRQEGERFDVKEWWGYEKADCCSSYMRAMWRLREGESSAYRIGSGAYSKRLANSLVGKLGANGRSWDHMPEVFHPAKWTSWWERHPETAEHVRWRSVSGRVEVETIRGWSDESIPAVASWVYSLGRVRLYQWMKIAGFENVFYCDTDSLWTNEDGLRKIKEAGELRPGVMGGLRVKNVHPWVRFFGHKHYDSPYGVVWAGRPKNFVSESDDKWTYYYSESPGAACRAKRPPTTELLRVDVPNGHTYRGGHIGADGRVFPKEVYQDERV